MSGTRLDTYATDIRDVLRDTVESCRKIDICEINMYDVYGWVCWVCWVYMYIHVDYSYWSKLLDCGLRYDSRTHEMKVDVVASASTRHTQHHHRVLIHLHIAQPPRAPPPRAPPPSSCRRRLERDSASRAQTAASSAAASCAAASSAAALSTHRPEAANVRARALTSHPPPSDNWPQITD